ncbi:MAG: sulfite exporter TauE/SafE family protein [Microbacteriaceae bacterium]|nr:MAG: sulfite exporter TauE/SafE family protein [Microbacteriaceae bacterium]
MLPLALAAFVVAILASFAQAITGFGFALVAIPLLALVAGVHTAVVGVTLLSAVLTISASVHYRRDVEWAVTRRLTISALIGMPLGLAALALLDQRWLGIGVAVLVVLFALASLRRLPGRAGQASVLGAGFIGGIFLTSTGMNGPPLVATLQAMDFTPGRVRATLQASFAAQDILAVAGFAIVGQLTTDSLLVLAAGLLGIPLGWLAGDLVFTRLAKGGFRIAIFLTLIGCAILLLAQTLLN